MKKVEKILCEKIEFKSSFICFKRKKKQLKSPVELENESKLESRVFHERAKDKVRPACAHRQCARLSSLQSGRGGHGQDDERVAPFCRLLLAHVHLVMFFYIEYILLILE